MLHIIRGLPSPFTRMDCAVAIGNFDGVHRGHQALLAEVRQAAAARGLMPAVLTFEPHPREFFGETDLPRISTLRDKLANIVACGIQRIFVMPFNEAMAKMAPAEFARDILAEGLACRWVSVGENFTFGAGRSGNFATLEELGQHYHFETFKTPLLFHGQERISSSRIRAALALGDLHEAAEMLGRAVAMTGRVVHGAALGRQLGFPTLNMFAVPPGSKTHPALHGIYAVRVKGLDAIGSVWPGVASIGNKPTVVSDGRWLLETHVFNWTGNAYGKLIEVEFVEKLRDEKKFSGLPELTAAISADCERAKAILGVKVEA